MFVQEFLNIARFDTDSEYCIHTDLRNVRIRTMNSFVQRNGGKSNCLGPSCTCIREVRRMIERERRRERETEREMRKNKKEKENNNPFCRDPPTHRLLSHSDSQCANTLSECFTYVAKVLFSWHIELVVLFVCFPFNFYNKFPFLYDHLAW
jgi:hypothetical protein